MASGDLDKLIQKAFYALASACTLYAMGQIAHMTTSVEDLNRNVAILIVQHAEQEMKNKEYDDRLRYLETHRINH